MKGHQEQLDKAAQKMLSREKASGLHVAALAGRKVVVRELITKYKCPVDCADSYACTPLHWAVIKGHVGVVRMLVSEFGADVAVQTNNGDTALNLAEFNGHAELVGILISEFGCSPILNVLLFLTSA